jgi:hypothetical protein
MAAQLTTLLELFMRALPEIYIAFGTARHGAPVMRKAGPKPGWIGGYEYGIRRLRNNSRSQRKAVRGATSRLSVRLNGDSLDRLFHRLPLTNFSDHVWTKRPENLTVLPLNHVEWSNLGDPDRVLALLEPKGIRSEWTA